MSSINRRDFVKCTVLSATLPLKAISAAQNGGYRSPNQAERGIKVACSVALWRQGAHASLSQALKGIADAGYEWAEGGAKDLLAYEDRIGELRELSGRHRLGWVTASLSLDLTDPNQRIRNIGSAVRTARLLQALDADFLTVQGNWGDVQHDPQHFQFFSKQLAEIGARVFEETGLQCAYHFQERDSTDIHKLIAVSDSRYVKFCIDTLSFIRLGVDPLPMIRTYAERVIHVHLHDGIKQGGHWRDVSIGRGQLNVADVISGLCEAHYDGWLTIEQEVVERSPEQDAAESLKRVRNTLARIDLGGLGTSAAVKGEGHASVRANPVFRSHREKLAALRYLGMLGATTLVGPRAFLEASNSGSSSMRQGAMANSIHSHGSGPTVPLPPKGPNLKPLFFAEDEYRDVSALVDAIIPATDTPGALDARADEFSDLIIWSDQKQHELVKAEVAYFRSLCKSRYNRAFAELMRSERQEFLSLVSGGSLAAEDRAAADFFERIRELTLHAYYAGSPQGLIQELGYKGNTYVTEFKGCTHPEHQG